MAVVKMPTCDWSVSIILGSDWLLHLAEEHRDQEGGAGGVGGGRQEEGDPGGHREHRGGDEVDKDVLVVLADQVNLEADHGEADGVLGVGGADGVVPLEVVHSDGVSPDLVPVQLEVRPDVREGSEHQPAVVQGHAGEPQLAGRGVEGKLGVVDGAGRNYFSLKKILDF